MNQSGFVTTNENCGFFDIHSAESFEIVNPGRQVGRILGLNAGESAEGKSYIDAV